jgi:hypothetical protein
MTDTPSPEAAQAAASNKPRRRHFQTPPPIDPVARARRIRIARATAMVARTKCNCTVAARACGLGDDRKALQDIRELCNFRKVPRRQKGLVRLRATPSRVFEEFIPRQESHESLGAFPPRHDLAKCDTLSYLPPSRRDLADLVAALSEGADPLGDDAPRADRAKDAQVHLETKAAKPKPQRICANCGRAFQGNRGAKFCGGACRIRHWRAQR